MPNACNKESTALARLVLPVALLLVGQCSGPGSVGEGDGDGWKPAGPPRVYVGQELFIHIDGGADIYYEYGFDRVEVKEYRNPAGRAVTVEIYTMISPESAFGIYTFKRGMEGEAMPLGNGGFFEVYYLNFWKGNRLVTLTGLDMDEETVEGIKEVARRLDQDLPGGGKAPALVEILDIEGLIESSIKYFGGPLGLFNCRAFFTEDVFAFDEGAAGIRDDGSRVFVFRYGREDEGRARFHSVMERFKGSQRYRDFAAKDSSFSIKDGEGRFILGVPYKNYIILVLTDGSIAPAESLAKRVAARIDQVFDRNDF